MSDARPVAGFSHASHQDLAAAPPLDIKADAAPHWGTAQSLGKVVEQMAGGGVMYSTASYVTNGRRFVRRSHTMLTHTMDASYEIQKFVGVTSDFSYTSGEAEKTISHVKGGQ